MNVRYRVPLGLAFTATVMTLAVWGRAQAPNQAARNGRATNSIANLKPLPADPEERFKYLFTQATLSGRWAGLRDGELGEERPGDRYNIVGVIKSGGENWIVQARMKYGDQEIVAPVPVQVRFVGDTAILEVNDLAIPGGGTYTARVMIYERTYSGTWKGQRGGGMLYGTITNADQ